MTQTTPKKQDVKSSCHANRHIVEESVALPFMRGGKSYLVRVSARFMEVAGGYIMLDDFKIAPALPFELTPADTLKIIDALYKKSDKRNPNGANLGQI